MGSASRKRMNTMMEDVIRKKDEEIRNKDEEITLGEEILEETIHMKDKEIASLKIQLKEEQEENRKLREKLFSLQGQKEESERGRARRGQRGVRTRRRATRRGRGYLKSSKVA